MEKEQDPTSPTKEKKEPPISSKDTASASKDKKKKTKPPPMDKKKTATAAKGDGAQSGLTVLKPSNTSQSSRRRDGSPDREVKRKNTGSDHGKLLSDATPPASAKNSR